MNRWARRILIAETLLLVPRVELSLRRRGFAYCRDKWAPPLRQPAPSVPVEGRYEQASEIAETVDRSNRVWSVYRADCLTRSLVLCHILWRRGINASLELGVRTITGRFEAHAWVEYGGRPINETDDVQRIYTRFNWVEQKAQP